MFLADVADVAIVRCSMLVADVPLLLFHSGAFLVWRLGVVDALARVSQSEAETMIMMMMMMMMMMMIMTIMIMMMVIIISRMT